MMDELGGQHEDAQSLLEEAVIDETLPARVFSLLNPYTDDVIKPIDPTRTSIELPDLLPWLTTLKIRLGVNNDTRSDINAESRPSHSEESEEIAESERSRLLKHIGAIALLLAEKSNRYKKGAAPNVSAIADDIVALMEALPDSNMNAARKSVLRFSITEGLKLLKNNAFASWQTTELMMYKIRIA